MADPTPTPAPEPTFWGTVWSKLKAILSWMAIKLAAPGVALVVIVVAVLLVSMGFKELQIGGLLAKLFGKTADVKADPNVANTVPSTRVDQNGNLIPQGTPDSTGQTQAVIVPIENTGGLFSNPDTVKVTPPGSDQPIVVQLPTGVKANDVDKIIIVSPTQVVVSVKDNSGIPAQKIDDLLRKYGG
jgi:hypothetical protein